MADANDRPCCLWCNSKDVKTKGFCAKCYARYYRSIQPKKIHLLKCEECGKDFTALNQRGKKKKWCSAECKKAGLKKWQKENYKPAVKETIECGECGKVFVKNYKHQKFCSERCASRKRSRLISRGPFTCKQCEQEYYTSRSKGEGETFCSRECSYSFRAEKKLGQVCSVHFQDCCTCSKPFASRRPRANCSRECELEYGRAKAIEAYKAKNVLIERACKECGIQFVPVYGDKRRAFCSADCMRKCRRKCRRKLLGAKNHRQRARKYGVCYEPIKVIAVFERDGWVCQICGKKTPKARRGTQYSNAPELDHRIPMSVGGSHTYDNVQCACRACNIAKGNMRQTGQIPLFSIA